MVFLEGKDEPSESGVNFSLCLSGVHILQRMHGCEWDNGTGDVTGFNQYGYDGKDFLSLDLKRQAWVAAKPQAVTIKLSWDADTKRLKVNEFFLTELCLDWLQKYVNHGKKVLLRTGRVT